MAKSDDLHTQFIVTLPSENELEEVIDRFRQERREKAGLFITLYHEFIAFPLFLHFLYNSVKQRGQELPLSLRKRRYCLPLVQEGIPVGKCLSPIAELKPEEKEKLHQVLAEMKLV